MRAQPSVASLKMNLPMHAPARHAGRGCSSTCTAIAAPQRSAGDAHLASGAARGGGGGPGPPCSPLVDPAHDVVVELELLHDLQRLLVSAEPRRRRVDAHLRGLELGDELERRRRCVNLRPRRQPLRARRVLLAHQRLDLLESTGRRAHLELRAPRTRREHLLEVVEARLAHGCQPLKSARSAVLRFVYHDEARPPAFKLSKR